MNNFFTKKSPSIISPGEMVYFSRDSLEMATFFVDFTKTAYLNTSLAVIFKIEKGDRIYENPFD